MSKTITKRHFLIYKITNKINGKIYIGKHITKNIDDGYMGSGKHLKRAINKYGIENFEREILFCFDNELEMNSKEAELVTEEFCLREDTYNLCVGGQGGFSYINREILDKEYRSKRSKKLAKKSLQTKLEKYTKEQRVGWSSKGAAGHIEKYGEYFAGRRCKRLPGEYCHDDKTRQKMIENNSKSIKVRDKDGKIYNSMSELARHQNTYISVIRRHVKRGDYEIV